MDDKTELARIGELFSQLDEVAFFEPGFGERPDWIPETETGREVFRQLTLAENRDALRKWYSYQGSDLNPVALNLKASLERVIGESLD